jgi:hypothetical protein
MEAPVHLALVVFLLTGPLAGCVAQDEAPATPASVDEAPADPIAFEQIHAPDEIQAIVDDLTTLEAVDAQRIGTSLEGRPISMVTVGDGDHEAWIVGRQHGDEPTGGEAILLTIETLADPDAQLSADAPPILETLREHRGELLDEITFHFVPVANPDGAAAYQRGTATGADPNRDHFAFAHPFSRALREAFWQVRPDSCLDLHNMGTGDTDFDAYGPEGPLMESEAYDRMVADANLAVREVDATGANGGLFNENYRAPAPADDEPNPTAFHPGTHDLFCTSRGAPGWTPEGAIDGGDNGAEDPVLAWSTRLHQVTVAAHALHQAGSYEAADVDVWKQSGVAEPTGSQHAYTLDEAGELRLQTVWRQTGTPSDHNAEPVRFTVTTPSGETHEGRIPHPEAWTSTVHLEEAETGEYTLTIEGLPQAHYEVRAYAQPDTEGLLTVDRTDTGLDLAANQTSGNLEVEITDVFDPADVEPEDFQPAADELVELNGTAGPRLLATWTLALGPGQARTIEQPEDLDGQGPFRFTAEHGERWQTGVEAALNPAAN